MSNGHIDEILSMTRDMEVIESVVKNKGRFVGNMVHISIADLATAIRQHKQDGGWRDISTAPKDGTWILITDGKFVYRAHYTNDCEFGQFENDHREGWQIWACEDGFYSSAMEINEAVKWQPLPPAPKKENDDG